MQKAKRAYDTFRREIAMLMRWEDGFEISATVQGDEVTIAANREGLLSLANILTDLAGEAPDSHVHLDDANSLEDGSCGLVVERLA